MRCVIVVQARMGSTRLPGKVLADLAGKPMLTQQLIRLKQCTAVDDIVVATTVEYHDDRVVEVARKGGVSWFRGSEDDVLSRYVGAAHAARAEVIVRVTADCPLIDPAVTDRVICELLDHSECCDYACNVLPRTYPRGLDTEVLFLDTLDRANRLAVARSDREHVTPIIYAGMPNLFLRRSVAAANNDADLRWTVDTPEDLRLVRVLYDALGLAEQVLPYEEVVRYVRAQRGLTEINAGIETWEPKPLVSDAGP